jgi:hypothetical protein
MDATAIMSSEGLAPATAASVQKDGMWRATIRQGHE